MSRDDVVVQPSAVSDAGQFLDVRWALGDPPGTGYAAYQAGHIPGARFLDLEAVLTGSHHDPTLGRHPLPTALSLAEGLGALGVRPERPIVVYDIPRTAAAARAWWVLRWAGLDVRVLDGGWPAWLAAGGAVETVTPTTGRSDLTLTTGHLPTIDAQRVAVWRGTLIDVRAGERFRGESEAVDPVAGHIPGAVNRPVSGLWAEDGTLPDATALRAYFGDLTAPVAVYCGSGVTAAQGVLALMAIGVHVALYPPSWSGWIADPAHPVATGAAR